MHKPTLSILAIVAISSVLAFAQQPTKPAASKVTVIVAPSMIDGVSGKVQHNVTVVVRDHRIESVGENATTPAGATVIRLHPGTTLLPGLIDTHTHIFSQGEDPAEGGYDVQLLKHPSSFRAARATVAARRALEQG